MRQLVFPLLLAVSLCGAPSDNDNTVVIPSLKGIVFLASPKDFKKTGVSLEAISVSALPLLDQALFKNSLSPYIGQPLTLKALNEITAKVSDFYKQASHPIVDVAAPQQDVSSGTIQILVTEFRVGEVRVQGNRWFSDHVVTSAIRLQHGDTINTNAVLNDLDAANANQFRHVDLVYQPSPQSGYTDLVLNTQDRFPVTVYSGFDNTGTAATGRSRWNMGATWGNAFQRDQTLSYQFSASDNFFNRSGPTNYLSNGLSWSMPLRNGTDSVSLFANYQVRM